MIYMDSYKDLYLKYKKKYAESKGGVSMDTTTDVTNFNLVHLNNAISDAHKSAYELIRTIDDDHKIITAESLTAGLISSVLASVPFGGHVKYGSYVTYDTDAKRVMLGVTEEDVYTHKCVEQMSTGALKNSNASIAIAVSGNAMPHKNNNCKIGEVFIAIAGYTSNDNIYIETSVHNFCDYVTDICNKFYNDNKYGNARKEYIKSSATNNLGLRKDMEYPSLQITETLALYIRYKTVQKALELCKDFITKKVLIGLTNIQRLDTKINITTKNISNSDNKLFTPKHIQ